MKKLLSFTAVAVCMISAFAFVGCDSRPAEVTYALSEDGAYYIVSGVQGNATNLLEYEVPAEYSAEEGGEPLPVKEIGEKAFMRCTRLRSVTLPEGLTVIGENAFTHCALTEITIPETVTEIGFAAFGACEFLTEVTIPQSVTYLDRRAFIYCTKLEKAIIKADITEIRERTFANSAPSNGENIYTNTALTQVYIGSSVKRVHNTAFYGNFLADVYYAGSEEEWNALFCYELVLKEDSDSEYEEREVEKSKTFGSATIHFNSQF